MIARPLQRGFTLIELVIFIVIVSVALVAVLQIFNLTTSRSADPLLRKQALTIAEAYMDEILSKSYQNSTADPDTPGTVDDPTNSSSTEGCTPTTTPSCSPASTVRSNFNDVMDYNGWSNLAMQPDGTPIPTTGSYQVTVTVTDGAILNDIPARRVNVSVTYGSETLTLTGYRTNYD